MKTQLDFIINGSETKRYHTVRTISEETVGHHSHGVALFCTLLSPNPSASLLKAALLHDLAEHVTGDIPSPAKRAYGISEQVSHREDLLMREAGLGIPTLTGEEERILKLADIFQGAIFCIRECEMGNLRMREILERYLSYSRSLVKTAAEQQMYNYITDRFQSF